MTTIAISYFRSHLLDFLKLIREGKTIVLTSKGREVAWMVPPKKKSKNPLTEIKQLRKKAVIGDITSPASDDWELK